MKFGELGRNREEVAGKPDVTLRKPRRAVYTNARTMAGRLSTAKWPLCWDNIALAPPPSPLMPRTLLIPLIVACALFMENMDSTVLSTSLPAIATSLEVNPLSLKLALTAYLVSLAIFIPVSGWVADRFGSRRVFAIAIIVFMAGSLLCSVSSTLGGFVGARFLQGIGGAMMVPVGRLVLLRSVPKAGLVSALNTLTVPAMLGPIMGPPLGGFITQYFHWRGIFLINIPVSLLGIFLVLRFIPDIREPEMPPLDLRGFLLTGLGLSTLVLGLSALGGHLLGDAVTAACVIGGLTLLALYGLHARRTPHPVLNLELLKTRTYRAGVLGGTLFRTGAGASPFLLPLMFQLGFGLSPLHSGLLTCGTAVGSLFIRAMTVRILRRYGFRRVLITNTLVSSCALAAYGAFTASTPHALVFFVLLATGSLRALQFTCTNALSYADIGHDVMSQATSFSSMMQRVSQSLGVAIGAYALELSHTLQGHSTIVGADFWPAFLTVGAISVSSLLFFVRLPGDAGAELSHHRSA
jgi:EmrB/QacA subfamily drug resistance transporter